MTVRSRQYTIAVITLCIVAAGSGQATAETSVDDFTSLVNTGTVNQNTQGSGNQQNLNVGSATNTKAKSFNANVSTGSISQSSSGSGIVQSTNIGSATNSKVGSFNATVTTGNIEQVSTRSGDRQELDIGSVTNSTVKGNVNLNVTVKQGVTQTGSGEVTLGSVKNSNVQNFSSNLEVKGKVTGSNIRMGSIVGQEKYDDRGRYQGEEQSGGNGSSTSMSLPDFSLVKNSGTGTTPIGPGTTNGGIGVGNSVEIKQAPFTPASTNKPLIKDPKQLLTYAMLSSAVYDGSDLPENFSKLPGLSEKDTSLMGLVETGFKAQAYYNSKTNEIVVAYAGTDDLFGDLDSDAGVLTGFSITQDQWIKANEFYTKVISDDSVRNLIVEKKTEIIITGHSLGGGLAQYVGAGTGKETYIFNPAAVPSNVKSTVGLKDNNSNIHITRSTKDPVSFMEGGSSHLTNDIISIDSAGIHGIGGLISALKN